MTEAENFNKNLDSFYEYLSMILRYYKNLIPILKDELNSILLDDIAVLDETLKSQQVLLSQTKNFDKRVSEYLSALNLSAKSLTEMTLQLKKDDQFRFFGLLGDFDTTIEEVNFYKDKCTNLLQTKLYMLDKKLVRQDVPKDNTMYNKQASEVQRGLLLKSFEQKV